MNSKAMTLSLVISIFVMFLVHTYIETETAAITKKYGREKSVVVAKVKINELELIDDSKVTVKAFPNNFVAPGSFNSIKDVDGTVATVPLLPGEQITKPRVTFPGAKTGLSRQVSAGKRALAIRANDYHSVGKLIKPGDRVDVIGSIDYGGGRKDLVKVNTILQDVYVLSTGKSLSNSLPIYGVEYPKVIKKMNVSTYTNFNTVTLEVSAFEAQKLIYYMQHSGAPIYLTLRNHGDKAIERIQSSTLFNVLSQEDGAQAKQFFIDQREKK